MFAPQSQKMDDFKNRGRLMRYPEIEYACYDPYGIRSIANLNARQKMSSCLKS